MGKAPAPPAGVGSCDPPRGSKKAAAVWCGVCGFPWFGDGNLPELCTLRDTTRQLTKEQKLNPDSSMRPMASGKAILLVMY